MISKKFTVNCKEGFHIRPAQVMMEAVTPFSSSVTIKKNDSEEADAKSILGLMSLGLEEGSEVDIVIDGADENAAMAAVQKLFDENFGE